MILYDRPSNDVTNDDAAAIMNYPPTAPSAPAPKIDISPVKRLKCTSFNMTTARHF